MAVTIPVSAQALILPINNCVFSAGYKNQKYYQTQGIGHHYGVDMFSSNSQTVYSLGDGEVLDAGLDGTNGKYSGMGNIVVILYRDVYIHKTKEVKDLVCRMFHFESVSVKKGDIIDKNTVLGLYGNTGGTTVNGSRMGYHLHVEFDSDTKWPFHVYGYSARTSKILKKGVIDSTINPSDVWFIKDTPPDSQSIFGKYPGWFSQEDINLPKYSEISFTADSGVQSDSLINTLSQYNELKIAHQALLEDNRRNTENFTREIATLKTQLLEVEVRAKKNDSIIAQIRTLLLS